MNTYHTHNLVIISVYIRVEEKELKGLHSKLSGKDYLLLIMLYSFHKLSSSTDGKFILHRKVYYELGYHTTSLVPWCRPMYLYPVISYQGLILDHTVISFRSCPLRHSFSKNLKKNTVCNKTESFDADNVVFSESILR